MRLDDETGEVEFDDHARADESAVPRRILAPLAACGTPRMDIVPAGAYGFYLAGDEVIVPLLSNRDRTANELSDKGHPEPMYWYLHDGWRPGLVSGVRPHGR